MKRSKVYRQAAELVDKDYAEFSCSAVSRVSSNSQYTYPLARQLYADFMLNGENSPEVSYLWEMPAHKAKNLRVMLLLMMAAVAESEGK